MAETKKVILDAGHGGTTDPGAVYQGRQEKNDNLRMALAVGQILSEDGVDVGYTRVQDVYQSPLQKAQMANNWEADYFVSFHRNAMPVPGTASGTESLIFSRGGEAERRDFSASFRQPVIRHFLFTRMACIRYGWGLT